MRVNSSTYAGLIGREQDLNTLLRFLTGQGESVPGSLVLVGEAGVGKSALLETIANQASEMNIRVIRVVGVQAESAVGFAALSVVLREVRADWIGFPQRWRAALDAVLGFDVSPTAHPLLLAEATLAALKAASASGPIAVLIDDFPWIDESSAMVFSYIARRVSGTRVRMVATSRTGSDETAAEIGAIRHVVSPLAPPSADMLLRLTAPDLSARRRQRVLSEARGNPLALLELPEAISDEPETGLSTTALPLGHRLQAIFAQRLDGLPVQCRELLLMLALEGTASADLMQRAMPRSRDVLSDLAPAEQLRLVIFDGRKLQYRFHHPLTRSAVIGASTASERRLAHLKLAQAYTAGSAGSAWHLAYAAIGADEVVATSLENVAKASFAAGDIASAVSAYMRAGELSTDIDAKRRRFGQAAYLSASVSGDFDTVLALLEHIGTAKDAPLSAAVATAYHLLSARGDVDTAHHFIVAALEMTDLESTSDEAVEALFTLARICYFGNRVDLWNEFDAALARLTAVPELLNLHAATLRDPARTAAAVMPVLDRLISASGWDVDPLRFGRLALACSYTERLGKCRSGLMRVVEGGRQGNALSPAIDSVFLLAIDAYLTGRWKEAEAFVDEGLIWCEEHGFQLFRWPGIWIRALLAATTGQLELADELSAEMRAWAAPRGAFALVRYADQVSCAASLVRGNLEQGYSHASAVSRAGELASHVPHAMWLVLDLVELAVRTGRTSDALAHVAAARGAHLDEISSRLALVVATAEALVSDDTNLFEVALSVNGAEQWPFEFARAHLYYGERLRRDRRVLEARATLTTAHNLFAQLGAKPWIERASAELRATGFASDAAIPRDSGADLTPQQRSIVVLAARGLTNKEIGRKLYLSPRTVSTHLYQAFPKLGVTTRAGLRDALNRAGDPDGT